MEAKVVAGKHYLVIREKTTLCDTIQITFSMKTGQWEETKEEEMEESKLF